LTIAKTYELQKQRYGSGDHGGAHKT
jgi:hypothetical protein